MDFGQLLPDTIFATLERQGWQPTGSLFPLNSYENRVYEIALEDREPIVAKYYRPGRWSWEAIAEEHQFLEKLAEAEIPVISPLPLAQHLPGVMTLDSIESDSHTIYYAFFPKFRGREHAEVTNEDRRWIGRSLGRMHNIGEHFTAKHRMILNPDTYGYDSLDFILTQPFLPADLKENIKSHLVQVLDRVDPYFEKKMKAIALHGDCHLGNILWNKDGPHLLDFDDMVIAPPVQDVWMLFNGSEAEKVEQRKYFFEGYEVFRRFDPSTLMLAEPLRTLRMIRHAAWIGQRYSELAFQRAFPYYEQRRYWEDFLQQIKEQIALLQELRQ